MFIKKNDAPVSTTSPITFELLNTI